MPTDLNQAVKDRYRNNFLTQLTNGDTQAQTVDDTVLDAAIEDAQAEYELVMGEDFEYTGITTRELNFQIGQIVTLTVWILQARLARESIHTDTRYQKWRESVQANRDRNRILDPIGSTDVTSPSSRDNTQPVYPQMQDPNFDNFVPGNDDSGMSPGNPRNAGAA